MNPIAIAIVLASLAIMQYACIYVLKRTNASLCKLTVELVEQGETLVVEFDKLEARNAYLESQAIYSRSIIGAHMLFRNTAMLRHPQGVDDIP